MTTTLPPDVDLAGAAERAANLIDVMGLAHGNYEDKRGAVDALGALNRATHNRTGATPNTLNPEGRAVREWFARWLVTEGHTAPVHDRDGFDPLETISGWSDRTCQQHVTRALRAFAQEVGQ